jgi:hypothetical protein
MRTQFCKNCNLYKPEPNKSGREWMNADGWCTLVRLNPRPMKTAETNWCDGYVEKPVPLENMADELREKGMIVDKPTEELIHADAVETPPEFKGLADHIPDAELVDEQTYANWRLAMHEAINSVRYKLDLLEKLVDTPIGDLE